MILLLTAVGCTLDQKQEYDPDVQLQFLPVMQIPSKALTENYPDGQSFAVSAWALDRNFEWNNGVADAEVYVCDAEVSVNNGGKWAISEDALWPSRQQRLTVIGYTPIEAFTECNSEAGVCCTYDMLTSQVDLLYTEPQVDLDKVECGGTVTMPFRHALAQIDFEIKNRVGKNEEIIVKSLKIDAVKSKGSFCSLPSPVWKVGDEEMELLFFEGEKYTKNYPLGIGNTWNVIPQVLATNVTIEYEYRTANDTGFTQTMRTCKLKTPLESGRHYTYTLTVGIDEVQFLLEIIEDRII